LERVRRSRSRFQYVEASKLRSPGLSWATRGGTDKAKIKKFGHVVLGVRDPARSVKFYTEVLGMELVKVLDEMQMAFFSFGERDHDIAVIKVPDEQPVGSSGFAHTALEIEGGQEQLRELYERLKRSGARVEFTADHVLTKSVYFFDPDGNRLEIFSQELPSASAKQYLHEAQAAADVMRPLDLETATSVGNPSS
jgi:catechol 2,3-dioxygenase